MGTEPATAAGASPVQPYGYRIRHEDEKTPVRHFHENSATWLIEASPPATHFANLQAATTVSYSCSLLGVVHPRRSATAEQPDPLSSPCSSSVGLRFGASWGAPLLRGWRCGAINVVTGRGAPCCSARTTSARVGSIPAWRYCAVGR
jgi:hypothetical protein